MELKEILTNYRKENDLSQREFARRCGLSNSLISILEMGKNPQTKKKMAPDLDTYRKLANAMGISVQKLFEPQQEQFHHSGEFQRHFFLYRNPDLYELHRPQERHCRSFLLMGLLHALAEVS